MGVLMHACPLCETMHKRPAQLCERCDGDRLAAASSARIATGGRLTYSNADEFSEAKWIEAKRATRAVLEQRQAMFCNHAGTVVPWPGGSRCTRCGLGFPGFVPR